VSKQRTYDVAVIGAGHAGIEAALAPARMGCSVLLITLDRGAVGRMSCNPAIGGLAKGHLVREVDALGGEMARAIDATGTHFKMLNRSRGPAVQGPRAQADRDAYASYMSRVVEAETNIDVVEDDVVGLDVQDGRVCGVIAAGRGRIGAAAAILTAGTFLASRMFLGGRVIRGGRLGEKSAETLSRAMEELGFRTARLKTGTPPRILGKSVDWSRTTEQRPDEMPTPFSFRTGRIDREQISCWITGTTEETHDVIRGNLHRSPLFAGEIEGAGPRYCPSIEDKVVRFAQNPSHHIFLEIEGGAHDLVYPNGLSTSLPEDVQLEFLHTVPGLESCELAIPGYAVEYDFFPTDQIGESLETKTLGGFYMAGQVNGTSGYEEAAAQGLLAGINAARTLRGEPPVVLDRAEAYIGVLIDDLVTCVPEEPYRMFTSRAEYRLLLRHDTADIRLAPLGAALGLLPPEVAERATTRDRQADDEIAAMENTSIGVEGANRLIARVGGSPVRQPCRLAALLRRPEFQYRHLESSRNGTPLPSPPVRREVEVRIKYAGYVERQKRIIARLASMENRTIPPGFDYREAGGLSREGLEKLERFRPGRLGSATRIDGVTPADISLLVVFLDRHDRACREEASP